MPNNYDEVVEQNRKNLTKAQIAALAKAAQEYGIMNAGNRAGALASLRDQYNAGYRGLQNMGLAGGMEAQARSGEVPRLGAQLQTPFDQYNRKLMEVENKQLSALGSAFAESTKKARAAAAKAKAEAEAAAAAWAAKQKRTAEYEDPRMVYGPKGDKRVTFDKQDADLSAALAVAEIDPRMAKFQNPNFQTAKAGYAGAAGYTSAIMQKQRADAFNERRYAEYEDPRLSNPNFLAERRKERSAALAAAEIDPRTAMFQDRNFQTAKAGYAGSMRRYQAANPDPAVVARKNYEAKDAVVKNMFRAKRAGEVSDDEYRAAVADRDIAKMHMEHPEIPIFAEIDHEAAGVNLERARNDYDSVRNASGWNPQPSVDEMHTRYRVQYNHYKGLLSVLDDPNATKADKDRARTSIESSSMTVDQARNFVNKYESYSPAEEPEDVRQARANAEMADLAYNHPDVYKALYYKQVMTPEMRAKYPEVAAWVDDTIARYNMESLGIKIPTMTRSEYAHADANAEDIMGLLNEYDAYDNRTGKEAERDATADLLMKRYHMTVDQAWDFIDNMRNQRDVWSEYDYYYAGARAQVEHNGEKPTQPVNEGENDFTYRSVNGLSRKAWYNVSLIVKLDDKGNTADFMTPEQRDAYNAIYEKDGIEAANEYYKAITPYLNIQRAAEDEAFYKKFAREHPFWADVRSVGANLLWNIPAAAENIGKGVVGMFTKDRPYYDVNSDFSFRSGRADAIRGQRSFDILNDMSNPENVRQMQNFAYNTGMSIADSAAIMGLAYLGAPEWVTALFFGSSAGNQAYKDARARGATQDQALALGIANGVFEALFEEVSLDKVMHMDHTGRAALIKNLLTHMFVEGSEEAFTGIADTLADVLIMGDKSEFKQAKARYLTVTKTQYEDPEEAERKAAELAFWDTVKEIGMDALGGMVSGGVFVLGGAAIHDVRAVNHGNMMLEDRGLNDRVTRTAELFGGKALEMLEKYQADPSVRNAGNLYMVVNDTMNELFGRTKKPDVDKITPVDESAIIDRATAASAMLSGDRMSVTTAENIIGVLGKKYLSKKGMNVSSPAAFANDYNARLAKYGIKSYGETVAKSFKFKTDTLEGFRNRKADQAYRAANPSYAGGSITGKALESRMANRQRAETAAVLNTAENNAAARVWQNPNMGYTTNADGSRFMNMPGNMTAVAMAEYSRKSFKAQTTATMDGVTLELAGMEARKGLTDAQVFAEAKKAMTKDAAKKLDVFMKLAKSLSMPMVIRDVVAGTSGYVHDGKLYVTLSGQQSIPKVVAHELTHFMKDHALQKYNALRTHLVAEVGNTKFNELMQEKAKSYGLDLDTEAGRIEADDEVCAELCERMLSNPDSLKRFVERNTDAAITLKDRLLKLLNAIKAALKDPANRNFGRSHSDLIKQEQTVEAWLDGINEAIKNANERAKTTEGRIAQVAGVTTSDQESLIRDIKKASETAAKAKQEAAAPVRTAEKATTEAKVTEKTTAESEPVKAATEADTESKKPAEAAKPAAKPRRYVRVNSTVSDRQGTTFEGGRAPRGMTDLTYKIQNATNFGSGLVTGSMSDYASFGYTSYFGNLDGDAYGYSKSTWRNAGGRAIRDSQAAVSSASDLKQGNAFVNDVLQYNFLTSEELGKANSMTESEIADRDAAEVDVASVLSADQIAAAETVAGMLAKGSEVVIQLPVTDNFDQLARATLKAVFEAMPANKRTGVSFATGLTSADISKAGDVNLIITDESQKVPADGRQVVKMDSEKTGVAYSLDTDANSLDSDGRELSAQQREYFKDSAIRDDDGKLLALYHGTTAFGEITQFKKGKRGWLGPGIYLTSRKADAQRYANAMGEGNGTVYELYANAKNPLIVSSANPAQDILRALYGTDTVFQRRSASQGNSPSILTAADIKKLQAKGYDGIIWNYANATEVSVFSPEQVKRTDNASPTTSKDIRYSIDTDYLRAAEKYKSGTATEAETQQLQAAVDQAAQAAGYTPVTRYHQTSKDFNRFNTENPVAGLYDSETPNGIFLKTNDHDIGIGGSVQMPLYIRGENFLHFRNREQANAWYSKNVPGYESLQNEMRKELGKYEERFKEIEKQEFDPSKTDEEVNALFEEEERLIQEMAPVENEYRGKLRGLLNQFFLAGNSKYDGIELDYDGHRWVDGKRENVHTFIAFNAAQVKSAKPVTYDDKGNIIPLSERFNAKSDDIRNSIDEEFLDTVNKTASTTRYTADTESERLPAYKPQGKAPRVREVMVPERAKNGDRVSDFVRSFLESDKASDEIVAELQDKIENGEWGSYTQLSNEEAMDRAKGYIARKQFTEAQSDFHDMVASGKYNVHTRALGLQLLTEAANRGDKASVLDIAADLRQLATDAGQSLQIFSVLKELSGVGAAWYMQKEIDRLNNQYAEEITAGKMNEITVAPELMQQLMQASTQAEVEAAEDAIAEQVADQLPLTWKSRITNWRYLSMLGNPTTHFRNLTGNVFMAGMNAVKDVVATGIERVAVKSEDRAHAVLTRADRNTWKDFASASFQEQEKNLRGSGKNGFGSFIQQHMRAFDTKWLNAISQGSKTGKNVLTKNGVMGMLEVEDTWFLKPAYQNALMQYMKAQGYTLQDGVAGKVVNGKFTEITTAQMSKAIDWASQQAWKATFRDASALASLLNKASNLNPVAHVLVEGIIPFKKTPVNIAKRGIEYSPIGVVMGAVQMVRDVRKGKMTAAQAIDNIASGVVGTSLMVIGMFMAKAGLLRAGGDDDKKKSTYLLDTGDQTYSLKFGNVSIGISALAPAAIPLLMGAALWDAMNRDGEDEWDISAITETIAGTLDPFMEMSVVSSLNSALKNYNKNGIGGALGNTILTALQSYGGQMLPTFVGKVGQFIDPITRTTKSSAASPIGGTWDYYGRSLMKKIPGVEALLEPDVNVWGRTTKKSGFAAWALDFANRFILPVNVKIANRDAVDDELIRLVESTGNISILPSDGDKYFTVDGKKYPMTAAQYTEFSKDRGQASYAALKEVMNSPAYQKATDAERADMLSNALKMAQKHVNTVWKEKLGALDTAKAPANTEAPAQPTGVKDIQGDYSDPALYQIAAKYPNAYDKAAKAKSRGIDPTTFLELYEKMDTYIGEYRGSYMRSEIMASNLTPEQKELMDDLLVSDKGRNPDYSSPAWFEVSMLGKSAYDEAKAGEKIGLKPEIYLEAYTKRKEIDAAKLGKERKPTILRYLDSLNISAPVYDYLLLAVFGIKSR